MRPDPHAGDETAVFPEDRFGIIQPRGRVTADTVEAYALALAHHPDWRPGFTEVWDVRHTPLIELLPTDIPRIIEVEKQTKEQLVGSTTLILTYKPLILFTAQFYATLMNRFGRTVIALDNADKAAALLGIDALPELQPDPAAS